ncbi:hypothetical protein [Foetidibacter luteolus]|uniref:hypothetical protein n=1 Tax=Foetidibacter luteolus TaxID=2608880 RepID=UPI00129A980A|nr:hypothetical protein [Foetidibacter luteolus]
MTQQLFSINGHKINCFLTADDALLFSSRNCSSVEEFTEAWSKKLSIATKLKITYQSIRSVKKEEGSSKVIIRYKSFAGFPATCEFNFAQPYEQDAFFDFLEKERYFSRTHEQPTALKAITYPIVELLFVDALLAFSYYQAIQVSNGTAEATNAKGRAFNYLVGLAGPQGVLAIAFLANGYLLYKIWRRFKNPPALVKFYPPG